MPPLPRIPAAIRFLATFLLSLILLMALAEVATRRWLESPATAVYSKRFGVVMRPYVEVVQSMEGWSRQRTNRYGFFDDDPISPRPRLRALLLGDSYAEGLQLAQGDNLSAVAERADPGLEVVNAGSSGRFPAHYAAYLPEMQREFAPDVVVMQVNDGDVTELGDPARLAELKADLAGRSALPSADASPPRSAAARLKEWFKTSGVVRYARVRALLLADHERARFARKFSGGKSAADDRREPVPARAIALADSVLDVALAVNPRLVLLYVPQLDYFATPPAASFGLRRAFWHDLATRHGIPLIDPTDAMLAEYARTLQPLHGFDNSTIGTGHINTRGHALIGRLMAEAIEARAR